ncbi:MAG: OmpA family protein [Magnetococcales bacterium]|nr:OmpA family protein [Magnetococcales bacterium]
MYTRLFGRRLKFPLIGILLACSGGFAIAEETSWKADGQMQWHPLESWHVLGRTGTQTYFAPADVAPENESTKADEPGWLAKGALQWHPQQSWHELGRTGTQFYLAEPDSEPEKWEEAVETTWKVNGWWQWHPQESWYALGSSGTQFYLAAADEVPPAAPAEVVHTPPPPPPPPGNLTVVESDGGSVRRKDSRCATPPPDVVVNKDGCWVVGTVLFRLNDAHIQKKFRAELKKVMKTMKEHPNLKVEAQGHTDATGTLEYNDKLSLKRATSVKESLRKLGISTDRVTTAGYGKNQPLNDNSTKALRALNRRVDLIAVE